MEPKKIKKLTIKKETISVLNDYEMSKQKGGSELSPCYPSYDLKCGSGITCVSACFQDSCVGCSW